MAKLGLIFVCVFLMVQWSLAARVVRDAPVETPAKAEGTDQNQFNFGEALATLSQGFQQTFTKENMDRLVANLGETGKTFREFGQNLINKAQETAADLANSGNKKDEKKT